MMSLFLLIFFLIYGGVHFYFFLKVKAAFSLGMPASICLTMFLFLMVATPMLIRILENHGQEITARIAAYVGYLWMGFIFLFFSASLALDIFHGLLHVAAFISHRDFSAFFPGKRIALILPLIWGISTALYGYFEARNIRTERVVIHTDKLPAAIEKLTIVQISDVHLGLIVRHHRLKRIIAAINNASPDILVSTGDLVDGQINRMTGLAELLQNVRPKFGKFAVIGNHEVYAGLDQAIEFTEKTGFRLLRNEGLAAGDMINIVGVDDPAAGRFVRCNPVSEKTLLSKFPADRFTLLLRHRPDVDPLSVGLFDLQLSGHVHQGQIFPFNLVTHLFYPMKTGLSRCSPNSARYVSRGTGTWGPPIRFLAPPEVTVFELVRATAPRQKI